MASQDTTDKIELGFISGCHGVQGWVKIFSHTEPPQHIFSYPVWQLLHEGTSRDCTVSQYQAHGKKLLAQLEGVVSRTTAETLVGAKIFIDAQALQPLAEGEYYWRDLIGLQVENTKGEYLGEVKELQSTGANDVLVIADGSMQRLVPYTYGVHVLSVDLSAGKIMVDWELDY